MRIICVGDTAGVGAKLAYFGAKHTDHSWFTISRAKHDIFGIQSYYGGHLYAGNKIAYCLRVIAACRDKDVIILHDLPFFAPIIRFLSTKKKNNNLLLSRHPLKTFIK